MTELLVGTKKGLFVLRGEPGDAFQILGVENAGEQCLHRHEREIGEGDAGKRHRQVEAHGVEARRENAHHPGGEQEGERQQHEIDGDERRGHPRFGIRARVRAREAFLAARDQRLRDAAVRRAQPRRR